MPTLFEESPEFYEPTLEEVLSLTWETQPRGSRSHLETRLSVVRSFLSRSVEIVALSRDTLSITLETAEARIALIELASTIKYAHEAKKTLQHELNRRGIPV